MERRKIKTLMMLLIERDHPGMTIQQLMLRAFQEHGTECAAAQSIGITQQSFSAWKYRLGLDREIEQIRQRLALEEREL